MTQIEELQIELQENRELLAELESSRDAQGIFTQNRVIKMIERKLSECQLPSSYELEIANERYGYDFY